MVMATGRNHSSLDAMKSATFSKFQRGPSRCILIALMRLVIGLAMSIASAQGAGKAPALSVSARPLRPVPPIGMPGVPGNSGA